MRYIVIQNTPPYVDTVISSLR